MTSDLSVYVSLNTLYKYSPGYALLGDIRVSVHLGQACCLQKTLAIWCEASWLDVSSVSLNMGTKIWYPQDPLHLLGMDL